MRKPSLSLSLIILTLACMVSMQANAQYHYTPQEIKSSWARMCGNGSPYPDTAVVQHPAPKGYKPFYITNFGRHGSRYLVRDTQYENFYATLLRADSLGLLTQTGEEILAKTRIVVEDSRGNVGELLPRGRREHEGIIRRMVENYPEVFVPGGDGKCHVEARSTSVPRVAQSMQAGMDQLKKMVETADIQMFEGGDSANVMSVSGHGKHGMYVYLKSDFSMVSRPGRIIRMLFTDDSFLSEKDRGEILYDFWTEAIGALLADQLDVDLFQYLDRDEIYDLWKHRALYFYHTFGPNPDSYLDYSPLLNRWISNIDNAIAGGRFAANLFYAHDTHLMPYERLIGIKDCCTSVPEGLDVAKYVDRYYWEFADSPMGGNVQVIAFRNDAGDVLVKVLMNEKEMELDGLQAYQWPYYRWTDVREYWKARSAEAYAVRDFKGVKPHEETRRGRLTRHVYTLADDSFGGRPAGTPDAEKAASYIRGEFQNIGLKPFFGDWYEHFTVRGYPDRDFHNVVGVIEGSDPVLKDEYIVLGAHYDHLGVRRGRVYNGADDNASGSAALIEVARELMKNPSALKRSVIFAAFDGEELGLFGSGILSDTLDVSKVKLMMSVDMVGWLEKGRCLKMEGAATIRNGRKVLEDSARKLDVDINPVNFEKSLLTATDTEGFALKGIPTLAVTTGLKSPYHKPGDDPELIDYDGLDKVTGYIAEVAGEFASDESFCPSGKLSFKHRGGRRVEFGPVVSIQNASIVFSDAGLQTGSLPGFNAGLSLQMNMKVLALRTDVLYERLNSCFPDSDNALLNPSSRYHQEAVTVPVNLLVQTHPSAPLGVFAGAGAYYSRVLDSNIGGSASVWDVNQNQWGLDLRFGVRIYKLVIDASMRYQMNDLFTSPSAPKASLYTSGAGIKYIF